MHTVPVFYDVVCPLTYVAHARTRRFAQDSGVVFEWVPWEIYPQTPRPGVPRSPEWQVLPPEWEIRFQEENLPFKPSKLLPNTNLALRACAWAEEQGAGEDFRDSLLGRYYERGLDIVHPDILAGLIERIALDPIQFLDDIKAGWGEEQLRANDRRAEELGVRWAPTFVVGKSLIVGDGPAGALAAALRG